MTLKAHRRKIDVGPALKQVSPAAYWYRRGSFKTADQARGAFALAYQQAMDGMGASVEQWMGLTEDELSAWMQDGKLPPKKASHTKRRSAH